MSGIVFDTEGLTVPIRIPQGNRYQIVLEVNAPVVTQRKGMVVCRMVDWTPKVDNLETVFDEFRGISRWEVTVNTSNGRTATLVHVNKVNGLS